MFLSFPRINSIMQNPINFTILSHKEVRGKCVTVSNEELITTNMARSLFAAQKSSACRLNIQDQFRQVWIFYSLVANHGTCDGSTGILAYRVLTFLSATDIISRENDCVSGRRRDPRKRRDYSVKVRRHCLIIRVQNLFMLSTYRNVMRNRDGRSWLCVFSELVPELETFLTPVTTHLPSVDRATSALDSRVFAICSRLWHHLFEKRNLYGTKTSRCKFLQGNRHDLLK